MKSKKINNLIRKNLRWIILIISTILFISIMRYVIKEQITIFDEKIYQIIAIYISPTITQILKIITMFGSGYIILPICLISVFYLRKKKESIYIILNLIIIFLLNQVLKIIIARPRPEGFRLIEEIGYSFPSGHSMVSMAFYGLYIYFIYKNVKNKYIKWIAIIALSTFIILIGISRIYLGVHYASDVLAGFLLSISYLTIFISCLTLCKFHL